MATVPSMDTFTAGEKVTAVKLNKNIRDAGNFLLNPPMAKVTQTATPSFAATAGTYSPTWSAEVFDTDGMVNLAGASDRITIQTPGTYHVLLNFSTTCSTPGGQIMQLLRVNGSSTVAEDSRLSVSGATIGVLSYVDKFSAGDYVAWIINTATTNGTITVGQIIRPSMTVVRLGA